MLAKRRSRRVERIHDAHLLTLDSHETRSRIERTRSGPIALGSYCPREVAACERRAERLAQGCTVLVDGVISRDRGQHASIGRHDYTHGIIRHVEDELEAADPCFPQARQILR